MAKLPAHKRKPLKRAKKLLKKRLKAKKIFAKRNWDGTVGCEFIY